MKCIFGHRWVYHVSGVSRICLRCNKFQVKVDGKWMDAARREW